MPHRMTHVQKKAGPPTDVGSDTTYEGEISINSTSDTLQFRSASATYTVIATQEEVGSIATPTPVVARYITMKFNDNSSAGAAGVYTASVSVPAGATIHDIVVDGVALWNAGTSATLIVGDGTDPDGYYTAVNLKATDLLAGESISFALAGGKAGAYIANSQVSPRYAAAARSITAVITTVGTTTSTGETRITVLYTVPASSDTVTSTYVAS